MVEPKPVGQYGRAGNDLFLQSFVLGTRRELSGLTLSGLSVKARIEWHLSFQSGQTSLVRLAEHIRQQPTASAPRALHLRKFVRKNMRTLSQTLYL